MAQIKFSQIGTEVSIEHFVKVSQLAPSQIQLLDISERKPTEPGFKYLVSKSSSKSLLGLNTLWVFDTQTI